VNTNIDFTNRRHNHVPVSNYHSWGYIEERTRIHNTNQPHKIRGQDTETIYWNSVTIVGKEVQF